MTAMPPFFVALTNRGWSKHIAEDLDSDAVLAELDRVGNLLGTRTGGRAGALIETVLPRTVDDAHPRSLSARYGLNAFPFHAELSHRSQPCRYVLLGCLASGPSSAATLLLDWRALDFSSDELHLLGSAPILVRTGRRSFYSTILPSDRTFLRYDPGCIEAIDARGQAAVRLVEQRLAEGTHEVHRWRRGDILIIDNWRILHGREASVQNTGRHLARILIDA